MAKTLHSQRGGLGINPWSGNKIPCTAIKTQCTHINALRKKILEQCDLASPDRIRALNRLCSSLKTLREEFPSKILSGCWLNSILCRSEVSVSLLVVSWDSLSYPRGLPHSLCDGSLHLQSWQKKLSVPIPLKLRTYFLRKSPVFLKMHLIRSDPLRIILLS